ncbi:unnamed protein product [Eruca vesicaria subsp. sativa]|uniref:Uncharacterized protein n=1 Tax=Eruca vesicaria subsp. sativa TaxID=29727 RepID=A0ABC8JES9_ERUVS|nr:unnamed protein product [Eruca vesicaria subsp. sativa]
MSGNQQLQISMPTWRCRDVNTAIPIKKRKYFVLPEEPGGSSPPLENNTQPNEKGDTRSALDLNSSDVIQKMIGEGSRISIGEPVPSVCVGKDADKPEIIGNLVLDQIRVKVEEPNIPIQSSPLAGSVIPSGSNIVANSLHCSLEKLPICAEGHPGVVVTSGETILKTHDIVSKESFGGECQIETAAGAGINNSSYLENSPVRKGVCAPHVTDSISTCTKSGNLSGVNRSNWDLNTTMDAWEDGLDRKTRVKTTGSFFDSENRSCPDIETPGCGDETVIADPVFEKPKETVELKSPAVTSTLVNPTCSLNLGISSYPHIEKSPSLSATASEARFACTSFSRPIMADDNVDSVNLRTVKSEVVEESAQAFPMGISVNRVKEEVVDRFRKENSTASNSLNPVDSRSVKAQPNNFIQSKVFNRKDGTLNHPHTPMMHTNEILDLLTSFTPNQKDTHTPYTSGISNAPMSMNGMTRNPGFQSYPDSTLKVNSGQSYGHSVVHMTNECSGHGDHNLNASDVNVPLTEDKILDDCKISKSGEEKVILSGKELREELYKFEPDCGNDLSRVLKKQVVKRNLYDDEKIQRPAAMFAEYGGSETEQMDTSVPFDGGKQNYYNVKEKMSQAALLGNTGDNEGRIVKDGEQTTHQIIPSSERMSGVFTLSGGKVDNPEIVDNISPASYKADISTIDNDPPHAESSEGSQSRIKTLDASDSFVPLRMERDRLSDFSLDQRKYLSRGSDESCKFPRERYQGKTMRSPRSYFMPDRSNFQDRDTKNFESNNYGNTRRGGGAFINSYRGRRPADDESTPFPHSFTRRTHGFSFTQRGSTNKEDASEFHGYRDGEKFTRGVQSNDMEPMFMNQPRPYQGRNSFARGRTHFSNNHKREYPRFRSRSPVRSRERSAGPSSSFRNRSQEDFSGHTDYSNRRSPSGYRMGRVSSPEHSGYPREMVGRRHNSPPYSHRPSNAGRGRGYRGYERGRGYARGRGYGRDGGTFFRKPYDRVVHRNHGNWNNVDPRERVDYSDDFFEGPMHSERFGVDDNVERRQFGYRHDGTSSFRQSFNSDGCAPTDGEDGLGDVRYGQNSDIEMVKEQEIDGKDKPSTANASGRAKNMEEEETSKYSEIWQRDELGGGDVF